MLIVSISGPSGAGKTTALNLLSSYKVLPERYMELNIHKLDNTLVASKWRYIAEWFDRILEFLPEKHEVVVADRSPLDTAAYVSVGQATLESMVRQTFSELEDQYDLLFRHILLIADDCDLRRRIRERLVDQPQRSFYRETDRSLYRRVLSFYRSRHWDALVDTTSCSPAQVAEKLGETIRTLKLAPRHG